MNTNNYFQIKPLLDLSKWRIYVFKGPRNIGKTTAAWNYLKELMDDNRLWCFLRNTKEEIEKVIVDFNARFAGEYFANQKGIVYRLDENGKCMVEYVGVFATFSTLNNWKSFFSTGVDCIIYDEYNMIGFHPQRYALILNNFFKTAERSNPNFHIIFLGNKDEGMDDVMNWLNIVFEKEDDGTRQEYSDDLVKGILIGNDDYYVYANHNSVSNRLAARNDSTNAYLNCNQSLIDNGKKLLNYTHLVKPYFNPKCIIMVKDLGFVIGTFITTENGEKWYIKELAISDDFKVPRYSIDNFSTDYGIRLISDDEASDLIEKLFYAQANGDLFFDSSSSIEFAESLINSIKVEL